MDTAHVICSADTERGVGSVTAGSLGWQNTMLGWTSAGRATVLTVLYVKRP
jgi:hypothetical protein